VNPQEHCLVFEGTSTH